MKQSQAQFMVLNKEAFEYTAGAPKPCTGVFLPNYGGKCFFVPA
jgi:hypothetical protein